ncbi:MAG: hypothetical protein H7835_14315 [Magnetococcus sp. XQGC-1]
MRNQPQTFFRGALQRVGDGSREGVHEDLLFFMSQPVIAALARKEMD